MRMRRRMAVYAFLGISFFVAFYAFSVTVGAQNGPAKSGTGQVSVAGFGKADAKPLPPGGPAPRAADGQASSPSRRPLLPRRMPGQSRKVIQIPRSGRPKSPCL